MFSRDDGRAILRGSTSRSEATVSRPVKIYTTPWCPYCHRAKAILNQEGIAFEEIDVDGDHEKRRWLAQKTGQRTVPQIFFGDESMGGCDDISFLQRQGTLKSRVDGSGKNPR